MNKEKIKESLNKIWKEFDNLAYCSRIYGGYFAGYGVRKNVVLPLSKIERELTKIEKEIEKNE